MLNKKVFCLILFLVALLTRTYWLGRFPTGITNDELHFILNAKAVFFGFSDMSDNWNPLSLRQTPDNPSAELTSTFLAPLIGPWPLNLLTARLPLAVMSSIWVVVIFLIGGEINLMIGLLAALLAIINPWFFYMGRMAFDQPIATFFLTIGVWWLVKSKGRSILWSILPLLLGFYNYIGTKVIFVPMVVVWCVFAWMRNRRQFTKYYLVVLAVSLAATVRFLMITMSGPSRVGELITPFSDQISQQVEVEREQAVESGWNRVFVNKITVFAGHFLKKYLNNFSPDVFFNKGDETYMLSLWKHGYFYYVDLVFLVIGFYYLFRKQRKFFWPIVAMVLLSPIPEAIRADNIPAYAFHSCWQYPFLMIIAGAGIWAVVEKVPKLWLPIGMVYLVSFGYFGHMYFYRYPVYQPDGFAFTNRVLSRYLELESRTGKRIVVVTSEPSSMLRQYLFYTNKYQKDRFGEIAKLYQKDRNDMTFENIRFTRNKEYELYTKGVVYVTQYAYHHLGQPHVSIKQPTTGLEMFSIYQSELCGAEGVGVRARIDGDFFEVEKMGREEFCGKYVNPETSYI